MAFNYYRKSDAGQFSFIRIPKALMTEESFDSLSLQSKLLYGMLIDRMGASCKNQWIDEENRVYIVYPIQEIQKDMKVSKHKSEGNKYLTQSLSKYGKKEQKLISRIYAIIKSMLPKDMAEMVVKKIQEELSK